MSQTFLPFYKMYQLRTLSQRRTLPDYAIPDFVTSVQLEVDRTKFVKELRKYLSRATEQLMHLKVSTQLRQHFYEKYFVDSEDSGHRYARIKFAELVTEGERKVSTWKRKLQELEFHERQASFLQTSSVGTLAVLYQTSRKGRRKQVHPQRTRKKAVIKRTPESDRADASRWCAAKKV